MGEPTTTSVDRELVKAYASEGSETAFRALTSRHVNLVYATALRQVGDAGMAEEITQNVFVALARKAPRLAGIETLAGWLHRTTILEAKTRIRTELRRRRREEVVLELSSLQNEGASPLEDLVPMLDEGLLNLREPDRLALVLRFLEDRSLREVGAMLGVDEDAARKRVARALDRLTAFFRGRGFALPAGVGAAAVFASATSTSASIPAGLAGAAATIGLASGGAATGLDLLILNLMTATKTQLIVAGILLAVVPVAWQYQALARANADLASATTRLSAGQRRLGALEVEVDRARQTNARGAAKLDEARNRLAVRDAQLRGRLPGLPYTWDDSSSLVRVPKELVSKLSLSAVANKRGQLSDQIKEGLQFTKAEESKVQAALDRFLSDYYAAQASKVREVTPAANDLQGHQLEDTRVFEVTAVGDQLETMRAKLFSDIGEVLGSDRLELFRQALRDWMPITNEYTGLNSSTAIFNFDHRLRYYKPQPGMEWLDWSLGKPNGEMMSLTIQIEDIPPIIRPTLQDWISIAQSQPANNPTSQP